MVSGLNSKKQSHVTISSKLSVYFFISVTAGEANSVEHKQPLQVRGHSFGPCPVVDPAGPQH